MRSLGDGGGGGGGHLYLVGIHFLRACYIFEDLGDVIFGD